MISVPRTTDGVRRPGLDVNRLINLSSGEMIDREKQKLGSI